MNIMFLTISYPIDIKNNNLYVDLVNELKIKGNNVYVVTPIERRNKKKTYYENVDGVNILRVKTLNMQKTNIIEKGICTLLISHEFKKAINKFLRGISLDLIMYSTPPITFNSLIKELKFKKFARTYLVLKDIFPQNAVDLEMMKPKGIIYSFFRSKEKCLYKISDYIGCMSDLNKKYLLSNNSFIDKDKVEIFPNSIKINKCNENYNKLVIRKELGIPKGTFVLTYGGNLGKPQGIDFLINIINSNKNNKKLYFLIIGSGTEFNNIQSSIKENNIENVSILNYLPKKEYNKYILASDVGLILLDKRFTIPNFPSRLLSYMENSIPVIAATDKNTDIRECIRAGGFGEWCESGDIKSFQCILNKFMYDKERLKVMGINSRKALERNFNIEKNVKTIFKHFN